MVKEVLQRQRLPAVTSFHKVSMDYDYNHQGRLLTEKSVSWVTTQQAIEESHERPGADMGLRIALWPRGACRLSGITNCHQHSEATCMLRSSDVASPNRSRSGYCKATEERGKARQGLAASTCQRHGGVIGSLISVLILLARRRFHPSIAGYQ